MSLDSLLYDSRRVVADIAVIAIEEHPEQLEVMIDLCKRPYPISMRAARVVQLYCEKHPSEIIPFLAIITNELLKTKIDGVKRGFLKTLSIVPKIIEIENSALLLDKSLEWLYSDTETLAVRVYCIDILIKYAMEEPELKNEIRLALENLPLGDYPSLSFRCRKGLKLLILKNDK